MKVEVEWQKGMCFEGKDEEGNKTLFDSAGEGSKAAASTPMQIFLQAMAVCSGMDIAAILHKRRRIIQSFRIEVEGTRREEHPRIFTHIKLIYIVSGVGINEEEIQRAMDFSVNKYCSIMGMVDKRKMKIEVEYRIE